MPVFGRLSQLRDHVLQFGHFLFQSRHLQGLLLQFRKMRFPGFQLLHPLGQFPRRLALPT